MRSMMGVSYETFIQLMWAVMTLLLFSLVWFYWSQRKILSLAWRLQSAFPKSLATISCYIIVRGNAWATNYVIASLKKYIISSSGSLSVAWVGPYPIFFLFDPEDIHTLLQNKKSFERGFEPMLLSPFLGNGLISCFADVWKVTRHQVASLFYPRNVDLMYPMINDCGRELVSDLTPHVDSGLCNVEPLVEPYILKSTCKLLLGLETEVDTNSVKFLKYLKALKRLSEVVAERFYKVFAWPNPMFNLLYKDELNLISHLDNFIIDTIKYSRKEKVNTDTTKIQDTGLHSRNEGLEKENNTAGRKGEITMQDVYKVIQELQPSITDKDMIDQVKTMFAAGTETSRVTLSACILALASHTDFQEKLYSEIIAVTGAEDCDVTPEHLRAMPYLDQVLKETLRRFLTVPFFSRRVLENLKLRDWTIPAGSLVIVTPLAIHYNPKFYPDPERFDPDRFSPENVAARGNHSFLAFGSGPRICIGKAYATVALKIFLIHILKKYKFSTTEDIDVDSQWLSCECVAGFKDGYKIEIEAR